MKMEVRVTQDGSSTVYLKELDEHYHSTFGAVQESLHVFVGAGMGAVTNKEVTILEVGFGTGLNCLLTFIAGQESRRQIRYVALEKYPLSMQVVDQLGYNLFCPDSNAQLFSLLHAAPWNADVIVNAQFVLHKIEKDLLEIVPAELPLADLVYFDAFSPEKQPEIWQESIFGMLFERMKTNGVLVTYCAKGVVRRTLQSVGFQVERIPGPPGKREMIRARKTGVPVQLMG
jgi:tRNA U34 5-methylaminomethyl-2-thiouridine-forming methyltransferase MnmC